MVKKNQLLTTKEASKFLRVSPSTLYRIEKLNLISVYRTPGGQRRFSISELEKYLKKSKDFKYPSNGKK